MDGIRTKQNVGDNLLQLIFPTPVIENKVCGSPAVLIECKERDEIIARDRRAKACYLFFTK